LLTTGLGIDHIAAPCTNGYIEGMAIVTSKTGRVE
jgi:hypothetical protein